MIKIRFLSLLILVGLNLSCKTLTKSLESEANDDINVEENSPEQRGTREQVAEIIILQQDADKAYAENNWQKAAELYRNFLNLVPESPAWFRLANTYSRLNLNANAIDAYNRALKLDQTNIKAWHNLAIIQLREAKNNFINLQKHSAPDDPIGIRARELENEINHLLNNNSNAGTKEKKIRVVKEMTVEEYIKNNEFKNEYSESEDSNADIGVLTENNLEISDNDSEGLKKQIDNKLIVKVHLANVRVKPTLDSEPVIVLAKDTVVIENKRIEDWVNIKMLEKHVKEGWIHESLVEKKNNN